MHNIITIIIVCLSKRKGGEGVGYPPPPAPVVPCLVFHVLPLRVPSLGGVTRMMHSPHIFSWPNESICSSPQPMEPQAIEKYLKHFQSASVRDPSFGSSFWKCWILPDLVNNLHCLLELEAWLGGGIPWTGGRGLRRGVAAPFTHRLK